MKYLLSDTADVIHYKGWQPFILKHKTLLALQETGSKFRPKASVLPPSPSQVLVAVNNDNNRKVFDC